MSWAQSLFSSLLFFSFVGLAAADAADINCLSVGGSVVQRMGWGYSIDVCRFADPIIIGFDGMMFVFSECEKWDFHNGKCLRGQCSRIDIVNGGNDNIDYRCVPEPNGYVRVP